MGYYAILNDLETGVVELAGASGLHLVPCSERDPLSATTFGTGELIRFALEHGISKLIIGLGGSATNDGGVGILQALGIRFADQSGREIGFGGRALGEIAVIDSKGLVTVGRKLSVEIACDVVNPLTGPNGASAIYGPQKGATGGMVDVLDANLKHFARKVYEFSGVDVEMLPGAGAAGGSGGGLTAFLNAKLVNGIDIIMKYSGLEKQVIDSDYIITGEGSIDRQTFSGKTLSGVLSIAKKYQKPVIAFAGKISDLEILYKAGFNAVFCILPGLVPLEDALTAGSKNLENCVYSVAQLMRLTKGKLF
jgi:glycerate kinase